MKITDMPHGDVQAAVQRLFAEITTLAGDHGDEVINRLKDNECFLQQTANKMVHSGYQPSNSHICARQIMGDNMFGIDDAIKYFRVFPLEDQIEKMNEIRTSTGRVITEDELERCANSHILIAVFRVWPLVARGGFTHPLFFHQNSQKLFHGTSFPINDGEIGWYLIRKTPLQNSTYKEWLEQIQLVGPNRQIPKRHVLGYTIAGHFLQTGEWLFKDTLVRCAKEVLENKEHSHVIGVHGCEGIRLVEMKYTAKETYLGIAVMKPQ